MARHPTFERFRSPIFRGADFSVSITSPQDIVDDLMERGEESYDLLTHVVDIVSDQILQPAMDRGEKAISAAETVMTLVRSVRRQVEVAGGALDAVYSALPRNPKFAKPAEGASAPTLERRAREDTTVLREAVRLLRARDAWRKAVKAWRDADAVDLKLLPEDKQDAALTATWEALNALVGTRAPDLAAFAEKMRIIQETETVVANGYYDDLLSDVEALRSAPALPVMEV
ncbi:hypothetical protein [Novosphingobium sp. HII-3]|uniref:hypothetical protein n=1 Tax=Novosphingobium sp. HII-3 TaxID=2075565 RepID=UPI000CDB0C98|nr:hypothetical protein [Novosphingobium sp. HII-3]